MSLIKAITLPLNSDGYIRVPLLMGNVHVSATGDIKSTRVLELTKNDKGETIVKLDWFNGNRWYPVALLVLFAWKPVTIPVQLWGKLSYLRVKHPTEDAADNLIWKFPIKLSTIFDPDFYHIPAYSRYAISSDGVIIDTISRKQIKWYLTRGYYYAHCKCDVGGFTVLARHRAIVLTHQDYPVNIDDLHVNHIDGIPGNDGNDNLEAISAKENSKHSALLKSLISYEGMELSAVDFSKRVGMSLVELREQFDVITGELYIPTLGRLTARRPKQKLTVGSKDGVVVLNVEDDKEHIFKTRSAAAAALGISSITCGSQLKRGSSAIYETKDNTLCKYYRIRYESDAPFDKSKDQSAIVNRVIGHPIEVLEIKTGLVTEYPNSTAAASALGVSKDAIYLRLSSDIPEQGTPEGYRYRYKTINKDWIIYTNNELEQHKQKLLGLMPLLVRYYPDGRIVEYPSLTIAAADFNLSTATVFKSKNTLNLTKTAMGYVVFKNKFDQRDWPVIDDLEAHYLKSQKVLKPVIKEDVTTGTITEYNSGKECALANNLPTSTMSYYLNSPNIIRKGNVRYRFKEL